MYVFLATNDGNLIKVDYLANTIEPIFNATDSEVAAIDVHDERFSNSFS